MGHTVFGLHERVPRPCTLHHDGARTRCGWPSRSTATCCGRRDTATTTRRPGHVARGVHRERHRPGDGQQPDAGDRRRPRTPRTASAPPEMLERAKRNLEEHFAWVGITERFDESLVLLGGHSAGRDVRYVSRNVARAGRLTPAEDGSSCSSARTGSTSSSTRCCNWPRCADRRRARFAEALERFKRANTRYRRWGRVTYTLPSPIKRRIAPKLPAATRAGTPQPSRSHRLGVPVSHWRFSSASLRR